MSDSEFFSVDVPAHVKRGWLYPVTYRGAPLCDKSAYIEQLLRDGCTLNGTHVVPIGVETFATLQLVKGWGMGILLKEKI